MGYIIKYYRIFYKFKQRFTMFFLHLKSNFRRFCILGALFFIFCNKARFSSVFLLQKYRVWGIFLKIIEYSISSKNVLQCFFAFKEQFIPFLYTWSVVLRFLQKSVFFSSFFFTSKVQGIGYIIKDYRILYKFKERFTMFFLHLKSNFHRFCILGALFFVFCNKACFSSFF